MLHLRLVHMALSYVNATAILMRFSEAVHTVWLGFISCMNHTSQSHRMGMEPIHVWHCTHKCNCDNWSCTIWKISLTSTQPIFLSQSHSQKRTMWTSRFTWFITLLWIQIRMRFFSMGWTGIAITIAKMGSQPILAPNDDRNRIIRLRCEWDLNYHIQYFHKRTNLVILDMLPTLYSQIFLIFNHFYLHMMTLVNINLDCHLI